MTTPLDIINLAMKAAGVTGDNQTSDPSQIKDAFFLLNNLLSEWQLYRFLNYDLTDSTTTASSQASYTVSPTGNFIVSGIRPDKIDAAHSHLIASGEDTALYPFMSKEGYNRIPNKSLVGAPILFYYDASNTDTGTIYFWPIPSAAYTMVITAKDDLGQFATYTDTITLGRPFISALLWNLAAQCRIVHGLPADPSVSQRAQATLMALQNSISTVPQAVQPTPSDRAGIFSTYSAGGAA